MNNRENSNIPSERGAAREIESLRTINTKTFENEDHSYTTRIFFDQVHYPDENGDLQEMDDSLVDLVNHKGGWQASFPKKAGCNAMISVRDGEDVLSWNLEGARDVEAREENSRVVYPGILPDTDLSCLVRGTRVKEDIILKSPEAPESFTYEYDTGSLKAVQDGDQVVFQNDEGTEIFRLSAPRMKDAAGAVSENIRISLSSGKDPVPKDAAGTAHSADAAVSADEAAGGREGSTGTCRVTITPDPSWLRSGDRVYPVTIDPVTTTSKTRLDIDDAHVDSNNRTTNYYNGIFLKTWGGDTIQRSFMKFTLPELSVCDTVVEARAYLVSLPTDGNLRTISAHKVTQSWSDTTVTWNNGPLFEDQPCDVLSYYAGSVKYVYLDVTRLVREWYRGGNNYGLVVTDYTELGRYTEYLAADCDDGYSNMRPHIDIMYVSRAGLGTGCSTHGMGAGRAGTVAVNDYNGNTIFTRSLFGTAGSRMPMDLTLTWNACSASVNKGYSAGCSLSVHQTIESKTIGSTQYYCHTDGTGRKLYYHYVSDDSKWKDEESGTLELVINTSSSDRYTIKDKEGGKLVFDTSGKLIKMQDSSGNTLTVTYTGTRVTQVTDGAGRTATLTYNTNSSGGLNNLKKITGPGNQEITLNYTGNHVKQVVDPDGAVSNYTYNTDGLLIKAASPYGQAVGITYDTSSPKKAKKLTEYGTGDAEGNTLSFTYGDCSTTVTDRKGNRETHRFNTFGSPVSIHDRLGRAVAAKFSRDDGGNNRPKGGSSLQAPVVQLLKDPLIMQSGTSAPWQKAGEGSVAVGSINTNSTYVPEGLGHSLKFVSSATTGYGRWKQDVTVAKGKTYTFSMYVRADITDAGTGSCFLRVKYYDASGTLQTEDSSVKIKATTSGFERLMVTVSVPSGATSNTVTCSLELDHVKGTLYGGMAQLEEGSTVNRVNLIDNGTFALGNTSGFTGTNTSSIDGVVSAAAGTRLPVYRGLTCLSAVTLRATPSSSGTAVTTAAAGQHLSCRHSVTGSDSSIWYYAENSIGQRGYVPASSVLTYIGGTVGTKNAKVAANNTTLYSSTSTTSTKVLEGIGAGTRMVINSQSTVSGTVWYRVGLLLGTTKYTGYMPSSSVTVINSSPVETADAPASISDSLDAKLYRMCGIPNLNKRLTKTFPGGGSEGDSYMVNLWGYDKGLPITGNDSGRHFGVRFAFSYTDGTTGEFFTDFGADGTGWQFLGDVYVAKKAYTSISVSICFDHQAGYAFFDGFALYRENYSQSYKYNSDGNVQSVTDIRNEDMSFTYNNNQDLTGITDPKGNHFTLTYDNNHRVTSATSAANVKTLLTYDSHGNVTKQGNANPSDQMKGTWVTRTMTSDGNHVSTVTSPDGKVTRYYWDAKDQLTGVKDPRSNLVEYTYDNIGRKTKTSMVVESGTVTDDYTYVNDLLSTVTHNGFNYAFGYDAWGKKTSVSAAGSQLVSYQYEANNGNLLKTVYANGDQVRYTYDNFGRLEKVYGKKGSAAEQQLFAYTYDREGNIATVKDVQVNRTWRMYYDLSGRLAQMESSDNPPIRIRTTYDVNGNMTAFRYGTEATFQTNFTYDNDNRERTAVSYGHTRTTHYDAFGRVTEKNWNEGETSQYKTIYTYATPTNTDNRSLLVSRVMNGGKSTDYTYDDNGNIKTIKDVNANKTRSYVYDKRNQVTRENDPFLNKTLVYTYNLGGNLTKIEEYAYTAGTLGTLVKTTNISYSTTWKDQMTSFDGQSITYDACGNMLTRGTKTYTWAQGKQLATVSNGHTISYQYDHNGMRVRKTVDGVVTDFRLNGDRIISRKEGSTVTYFSYDSAGQLIGMAAGSNRYFYVRNVQNDIVAIIDANGTEVVRYEYDAWGNPISTTGTLAGTIGKRNPFRYRGYYWDEETGMYYLQSRYYDPEIRRFISADSIGTKSLSGMNIYVYCCNNPVINVDPTGYIGIIVIILAGVVLAGTLTLSGCAGRANTSEYGPNCYSFAFGFWGYHNPGDRCAPFLRRNNISENVAQGVLSDMHMLNHNIRRLHSPYGKINPGEYRVALRVGTTPYYGNLYDYHFMRQIGLMGWAEKHGQGSIVFHPPFMQPDTIPWTLYGEEPYYDSDPIVYFAVEYTPPVE